MKRTPLFLALVTLFACGYSEDDYVEDYIDVACGLWDECGLYSEYFTREMCESIEDTVYADTGGTWECTFNADVAQDCIAAWEELTCDDLQAGNLPSICYQVYTDCHQ